MRSRRAPIARSCSRLSRTGDRTSRCDTFREAGCADTVTPASMLRVGRIAGAHGLKGALRFRPDNPDSDTLEQVKRVFLERDGAAREFRISAMTPLNATTR